MKRDKIVDLLKQESDNINISNDIRPILNADREDSDSPDYIKPRRSRRHRILRVLIALLCCGTVGHCTAYAIGELQPKSVVILDSDSAVALYLNRSYRVVGVESMENTQSYLSQVSSYYLRPLSEVLCNVSTQVVNGPAPGKAVFCFVEGANPDCQVAIYDCVRRNVGGVVFIENAYQNVRFDNSGDLLRSIRRAFIDKITQTQELPREPLSEYTAAELYNMCP